MRPTPSTDQLRQVLEFLRNCERAADPPPHAPAPVSAAELIRRQFSLSAPDVAAEAKRLAHPRSVEDLMDEPVPFQAPEKLGGDRTSRIALLKQWLGRFPAVTWLQRTAAISSAQRAFERVQMRRRSESKFPDILIGAALACAGR